MKQWCLGYTGFMGGWVLLLLSGCPEAEVRCPQGMVMIPAGPARLGVDQPRVWQETSRTVSLHAYCIDTYEYPNVAGEPPQAQVTWDDANAACLSIGKRLCTAAEWERACRGPEGRMYAYGETRDATACNTPIEGGSPGPVPPKTKSGGWSRCQTPEGVFDLNGSLSEWVSDPWDGEPEPFNRELTVNPDTWRTLRGGTMWSQTFYGQDCTSRHGHQTSFHNIDDGFRCCQDAN